MFNHNSLWSASEVDITPITKLIFGPIEPLACMLCTSPMDCLFCLRNTETLFVLIPWRSWAWRYTIHNRWETITTYFLVRMKESPYVVSLALLMSIPVELYICLWVGWYPILDLFSFCLPCPLTLFGFLKNLLWSFKSTWIYLNPCFDHLQGTKCMVALSLSLWIMLNYGSSSITKVFMRGSGDLHVILFYHSNTVSGSGVYLFK